MTRPFQARTIGQVTNAEAAHPFGERQRLVAAALIDRSEIREGKIEELKLTSAFRTRRSLAVRDSASVSRSTMGWLVVHPRHLPETPFSMVKRYR